MLNKMLDQYTHTCSPEEVSCDLQEYYSLANVSECDLFKGDYINFGYWDNINLSDVISIHDRILASKALYVEVLNKVKIKKPTFLYEIGFGLGAGLSVITNHFPESIIGGVDASKDHYEAVGKRLSILDKKAILDYGSIEAINLNARDIDVIISVEVLQHCASLSLIFDKVHHALPTFGEFVFCTFLSTSEASDITNIPTVRDGIDHIRDVSSVCDQLRETGFSSVETCCISENVWPGFNQWIKQTEYNNSWNVNWLTNYREGKIGYYIVRAVN
jgi:hypothetical protein